MVIEIEQADGTWIVGEDEPACGLDFCDRCGDCLYCYGGTCYAGGRDNGDCRWVKYYVKEDV